MVDARRSCISLSHDSDVLKALLFFFADTDRSSSSSSTVHLVKSTSMQDIPTEEKQRARPRSLNQKKHSAKVLKGKKWLANMYYLLCALSAAFFRFLLFLFSVFINFNYVLRDIIYSHRRARSQAAADTVLDANVISEMKSWHEK